MNRPSYPRSRGAFTLIELLVVISIIALLSSVVLSSLNSARAKGKDAAARSQMAEIRTQAGLYYSEHGSYKGAGVGGSEDTADECTNPAHASFAAKFPNTMLDPSATDGIHRLALAALANRKPDGSRVYCGLDATRWALALALNNPESGTTGWCVDSTGASRAVNLDFSAANNSFYSCP